MIVGVMGIDPGVNGGVAILDMQGNLGRAFEIPTLAEEKKNRRTGKGTRTERYFDLQMFTAKLPISGNVVAYLERAGARPKEAAAFAFKFGEGYGIVKGMLAAMDIPFKLVSPGLWMSTMHRGMSREIDTKDRTRALCADLWPELETRYAPKRIHDGVADAALIAEYGRNRILAGYDDFSKGWDH